MSNERKGTATPLAKAVIGPLVDKLIADGVLPRADYTINAGIHDEAIIKRADPGDDEEADEDEDDEDERASDADAAASRRAVGYDDVVDCLNEAIGMVRRTADPAKLMAERKHFDMLCATARCASASGAGNVLMGQEARAAEVIHQLQQWLTLMTGNAGMGTNDVPMAELSITSVTCAIAVDDEVVWDSENGYAEDVDAPDDEPEPNFERCRAAFQRRCARLAAFANVVATAQWEAPEGQPQRHHTMVGYFYPKVKPSCGTGNHRSSMTHAGCIVCGMSPADVVAEYNNRERADGAVGVPRMASVISKLKAVKDVVDEASRTQFEQAWGALTDNGLNAPKPEDKPLRPGLPLPGAPLPEVGIDHAARGVLNLLTQRGDQEYYDLARTYADTGVGLSDELREQLRGAMYDWRTKRGIV